MTEQLDHPPAPPTPPAPPLEITVRAAPLIRTVVAVCVAMELLLVLLDYHVNYGGLTDIERIPRAAVRRILVPIATVGLIDKDHIAGKDLHPVIACPGINPNRPCHRGSDRDLVVTT